MPVRNATKAETLVPAEPRENAPVHENLKGENTGRTCLTRKKNATHTRTVRSPREHLRYIITPTSTLQPYHQHLTHQQTAGSAKESRTAVPLYLPGICAAFVAFTPAAPNPRTPTPPPHPAQAAQTDTTAVSGSARTAPPAHLPPALSCRPEDRPPPPLPALITVRLHSTAHRRRRAPSARPLR